MFRAAASTVARRTLLRSSRTGGLSAPITHFHASSKRQEEAAPAPPAAVEEEKKGFWDPIYSIPLGIAFAVPAINYEWYLVNEETQLAACFMAFTMIIYKQFGGTLHDMLAEDGKRILAEHNAVEDEVVGILQTKLDHMKIHDTVVQDAEDVLALKVATYAKLNAAGQIKPQHEFKAQMEKLLSLIAVEETAMLEKSKAALMEEATAAVTAEFAKQDALKTASLANAVAQLQGKGTKGVDPVQQAYVDFFKAKAAAASKMDEKQETLAAREAIVTKLNSVAMNEGFFFELDEQGKPKMTV